MTKNMTEQIGLHKFKLAQKRFSNGSFYLSVILYEGKIRSFDARFFVEDGLDVVPTKNGLRIPLEKLEDFKKVLNNDLRDIGDIILFDNNAYSFHIRYMNDKYGEGIDFRKYKTSDKYTGWDRSGIRMKLEDVSSMYTWLQSFDTISITYSNDLFADKDLGHTGDFNHKKSEITESEINPALKKILNY